MVLKIKGVDRNGFIKPVLSTDRDVLHHQCIMGISIYFTLASGQLSLGAAGFMSVGAYDSCNKVAKSNTRIPKI